MQAVPSVSPFPTVHAPPLMSLSAGIRWATLALAIVLAAGSGATTAEVGAWAVGLGAAAAASVAIAVPFHLRIGLLSGDGLRLTAQWAVELVLVALLAGYARRLFGEAQDRHTLA